MELELLTKAFITALMYMCGALLIRGIWPMLEDGLKLMAGVFCTLVTVIPFLYAMLYMWVR